MHGYLLRTRILTAAAAFLSIAAGRSAAAVAESSSGGFTIKISIALAAPPDETYRRLVRNIGDWWDPEHTYSGDSHNLSIEEKPMGCFCEKLPDKGAVRHMEVLAFFPGKRLVMSGGLGPLQAIAVSGVMIFAVTASGGGSKLDFSYTVGGYYPAGLDTLAGAVDAVLMQQLTRLKNYVERGDPTTDARP